MVGTELEAKARAGGPREPDADPSQAPASAETDIYL